MGPDNGICPQSIAGLLKELAGVAQPRPDRGRRRSRCCDGHVGESRGTVHGAASLWGLLLWPLSYLVGSFGEFDVNL